MCIPCWYCMCVTVYVYLCRWTSWKAWWAAVCLPCHQARHSGQCQAPCNRSSPSPTATACGSHSAEGWRPERCQPGGEWDESENTFQLWWQQKSEVWRQSLCFISDPMCSTTEQKTKDVSLSKYCLTELYITVELNAGSSFGGCISQTSKTHPINCITCYQYVIFE